MDEILIKNARLIGSEAVTENRADLLIADGRLKKIGTGLKAENARIIDAGGLAAAPGLVDVHVHFRDPGFIYKEDIHTGARAAAKGGFTSVVMMGNTKPSIDSPEILSELLERAAEEEINIYSAANLTKGMLGKEVTCLEELKRAGAVCFSDDGHPVLDEKLLKEALKRAAVLRVPVSLHEEDPAYIKNNGINEGAVSKALETGGSDRMAEISLVKRDIELAIETGARLDIQHISTKEAVELVREGKRRGGDIHAEATPHHFTLTEEAVKVFGTNAKMNPPLRTEEDRHAIIEGLRDGTIDIIATDHAPHSRNEKGQEFTKAPSGITGLETAFALGITELVDKGYLSLEELIRLMSCNPAKIFGLEAGRLTEGEKADIIIFDPEAEWIFREEEQESKSFNSPFYGRRLRGRILYTICNGRVVYDAGAALADHPGPAVTQRDEKQRFITPVRAGAEGWMKYKERARVISQERLAEGIFSLWMETEIAKVSVPGQFISVYAKDSSRLLPRPISICETEGNRLRIVYRTVGGGTKEFSGYESGDMIEVLGPLGNGFPEEEETALLIGGGIGLPPMLALAKSRPADKNIIVAGYRNSDMFLLNELAEHGTLHIALESLKDASFGESGEISEELRIIKELLEKGVIASCSGGNVLDAIRENSLKERVLFACGPTPMLRALKDFSQKENIRAWFSLEQRMACGIGVCLACVCDTKERDEHSRVNNKRICREGPVFSSEEVIL